MSYPTYKSFSYISEGFSTDLDINILSIHMLPPSTPTHEELVRDNEKQILKRIIKNVEEQSRIFYSFNSYKKAA